MTQQVIYIGATPNDGQGDSIRSAFTKTNDNFSQLYSIPQSSPPTTLTGNVGDFAGMYAYDSTYFYYCFADYTGNSAIWAQITQAGNVSVTAINNGTSNVKIVSANANATINIGGTSNVAVFATTGVYVNGVVSAAGNVRGGNVNTAGNVTGNYILGNGSLLTGLSSSYSNANVVSLLASFGSNTVSTTGNVTGGYILGNGSQLTGLPATYGNANVTTLLSAFGSNSISTTGNVTTNYLFGNGSQLTGLPATYGNANVTTLLSAFGSNTISTTGTITSGNIAGSNINTLGNVVAQGIVSASGNIVTAGYFVGNFAGNITGNLVVTGSNTQVLFNTNGNVDAVAGLTYNKGSNTLTVLGIVSSQGTVQGGNLTTAGQISAAGNITGNYILGNGSQLTGLPATYGNSNVTTLLSAFGSNTISTSGNITGGYILGNGSQLTGLSATYGNSNVATLLSAFGSNTISTTGNITGGNLLTGGLISTAGNIVAGNITSIGIASVTGNILTTGLVSSTGNVQAANVRTTGQVSATGNITGSYILGNGSQLTGLPAVYGNSNVTTLLSAFGSNTISTTGNVASGNLSVGSGTFTVGNIVTTGNVSGNIGSSSNYFNTVFATATTALYADLAENYQADANYAPGTVVAFGGDEEITLATQDNDSTVAGVVSTNPAYQMNSGLTGNHVVTVALLGRVPCLVQGPVNKGALMVSAGNGRARAELNPAPGAIIGKAVQSFDGDVGTIEIVVGRV